MADLGAEGLALIALANQGHAPSDADRVRVRTALAARLGAAAGLGTAVGLGASAAKAAFAAADAGALAGGGAATAGTVAVGGTLATKLIGVIVVAATVGGSAAAVNHARRPLAVHVAPAALTTAVRQPPPALTSHHARSPESSRYEPEDAPPLARPARVIRRPQVPAPRRARVATREPVAVAPPLEAPAPEAAQAPGAREMPAAASAVARPVSRVPDADSSLPAPVVHRFTPALDTEARLVREGVAALEAGEPARALVLFDAHALRYPRGVLAEERAAERALALAALGRHAEARAAAAEFVRAHPTSPLATRLRRTIPPGAP